MKKVVEQANTPAPKWGCNTNKARVIRFVGFIRSKEESKKR